MREYLFIVIVAAIVTYAATPLLRSVAVRLRAFTPVRDRDVHSHPIPRLGGVSMFLGFAAATLVASVLPFSRQMFNGPELRGVLIGGAIVCLVGAIDDVRELDWMIKLAGQLLAAGIMAFQGVQLFSIPLGETVVLPAPLLIALTIFFVILATNAVNFVDGLDGLATGIVAIAAVSFFGYAYLIARSYSPPNVFTSAAFISAALVGVCLGFLPHNFHPARIFMGDSGALFLGLLLAAAMISITGTITGSEVSTNPVSAFVLPLVVPFSILLLPVLDVVLAVIRRTRRGQSPFKPDAQHLHHRMLMWGHGHRRAVLLLWFWAAVAAFGSVSFVFLPPQPAVGLVLAMAALAGFLTFWLPRATIAGRAPADLGPDSP
ncbi:MAG: undecaprenyl/decaprenyl-phosphate alpha-N-acetylglucosaminyl 1-phosphate transferase [Actinobacteria bacterium]|nr:undecaprenyl/decaprenyl-phosphate alpha-N-acetylglucosaminyl 1-phosphate transferase [Actinomycetota bacterium]